MGNMKESATAGMDGGNLSPTFVRAAKHLLRPLVRMFLSQGMTYPYLADLLKGIYVEVAGSEFALTAKRQTDSRLSLITGVHRKDVRRLAHVLDDPELIPGNLSLGNRLIARWCNDPLYTDAKGRPRQLPRLSRSADEVSFERLVADESKDIRARAVLDDWLHLGRVEIDAQDRVRLRAANFVVPPEFEEKAYFYGHHLHDHIAAAGHNLRGQQPPFMERSVYCNALPPEAVKQLAELSEQLGMETLRAIDKRVAEAKKSVGRKPGAAMERMTFGIYFYKEPVAAGDVATDHAAKKP
jgi:hypothetical protein